MKPQRIQLSRKKGFSLQAVSQALNELEAVNVARPTGWGNPFAIGAAPPAIWRHMEFSYSDTHKYLGGSVIVENAEEAVRLFRCYAAPVPTDLTPLAGKNLACWCALDQPCHADVLLALANPSALGKD